ncbi:MAG: hypothetical protein ACI92N_003813 [Pseudomonadales bacterium]|jgi:hypothetical protein
MFDVYHRHVGLIVDKNDHHAGKGLRTGAAFANPTKFNGSDYDKAESECRVARMRLTPRYWISRLFGTFQK